MSAVSVLEKNADNASSTTTSPISTPTGASSTNELRLLPRWVGLDWPNAKTGVKKAPPGGARRARDARCRAVLGSRALRGERFIHVRSTDRAPHRGATARDRARPHH